MYRSYFEALIELPDEQRLNLYDAISRYALDGEEVNLKGVEKAIFLLIKPQISANITKYENGKKGAEYGAMGGRPRKNAEDENPEKNPKKPQENPTETTNDKNENPTGTPNVNVNVNENVSIPPYNPPLTGGDGEESKEKFFSIYPKLRAGRRNYDDKGVDYKILLNRFSVSERLRKTYSMKWVCENYAAIRSGAFTDEQSASDQRAERERWYARRKELAENTAQKYIDKAMSVPTFSQAERRLRMLAIEEAKAEVRGDTEELLRIGHERKALTLARAEGLKQAGVREEDLVPRYHCAKCSDTGFLPDGRACDCYQNEEDGG